jgi:hypothetical protein
MDYNKIIICNTYPYNHTTQCPNMCISLTTSQQEKISNASGRIVLNVAVSLMNVSKHHCKIKNMSKHHCHSMSPVLFG